MILRPIDLEADHPVICTWWAQRNLPPVPKVLLRIAQGVMVTGSQADIACGWMYFDETRTLGVIDWITTNPEFSAKTTATEAIARILDYFQYASKKKDCHNLLSFVAKDTGLHRLMVKHGWQDPKSEAHVYLFKGTP